MLSESLKSTNRGVKEIASETLVRLCLAMSRRMSELVDLNPPVKAPTSSAMAVAEDDVRHWSRSEIEERINSLLGRLKIFVQREQDPTFLIACLQSYGSMARCVRAALGTQRLLSSLDFLIENSEATLFEKLDRFENFDYEKNPQNFKAILFNQKQLVGLFRSLSFVLAEIAPSDPDKPPLDSRKVRYLQDLIDLGLRYLPNFFPPYLASLCDNFSAFLNSFPRMNYNKLIFRNLVRSILFSMDRNCQPFDHGHQSAFVRFFQSALTRHVMVDRQLVIMEEFLKVVYGILAHNSLKELTCKDPLAIRASKETRDAFNVLLLLRGLASLPQTALILDSLAPKCLDILWLAESKLRAKLGNFVFLFTVTTLLGMEGVQRAVTKQHQWVNRIHDLFRQIDEAKDHYPDGFCLILHQFCFRLLSVGESEAIRDSFCAHLTPFLDTEGLSLSMLAEAVKSLQVILGIHTRSPIQSLTKTYLFALFNRLIKAMSNLDRFTHVTPAILGAPKTELSAFQMHHFLREGVEQPPASLVSETIMNIIKNCNEDFEVLRPEQVPLIDVESPSAVQFTFQTDSLRVTLPLQSTFVSLVGSLIHKKTILTTEETLAHSLVCLKTICGRIRSQVSNLSPELRSEKIRPVVVMAHLSLCLLNEACKDSRVRPVDVTLFFQELIPLLLSDPPNLAHVLTQLLDTAQELFTADLDVGISANNTFLEEVAALLRTHLTEEAMQIGGVLDHLLEHIRIYQNQQSASLQQFQITLFKSLVDRLTSNEQPSTVRKALQIHLELLQSVRIDDKIGRKAVGDLMQSLLKATRVLVGAVRSVTGGISLNNPPAFYERFFAILLDNVRDDCVVPKLQTLLELMRIDFLREKMAAFFGHRRLQDMLHEKNDEFLPVFYALFCRVSPWFFPDPREGKTGDQLKPARLGQMEIELVHRQKLTPKQLLYVVLVEADSHNFDTEASWIADGSLTASTLVQLFDTAFLSDEKLFDRVLAELSSMSAKGSPLIDQLGTELLGQGELADSHNTLSEQTLSGLKGKLRRIKRFFRQTKCSIALSPGTASAISGFLVTTLRTRDEMSVETQMGKSLLSLLVAFGHKIPAETFLLDRSGALIAKVAKTLMKGADRSSARHLTSSLIQESMVLQAIPSLDRFARLLQNAQSDLLYGVLIDLAFLNREKQLLDVQISEVLQLIVRLAECGCSFTASSTTVVLELLSKRAFAAERVLVVDWAFEIASKIPQMSFEINSFLDQNELRIAAVFASTFCFDTSVVSSSSDEYRVALQAITRVVGFVAFTGEFRWLRLLDPAVEKWNSKLAIVVKTLLVQAELAAKNSAKLALFMSNFVIKVFEGFQSAEPGQDPQKPLKIFENLVQTLAEVADSATWFVALPELLNSLLSTWNSFAAVIFPGHGSPAVPWAIQIQQIISMTILARLGIQTMTKKDITDGLLPSFGSFNNPANSAETTKHLIGLLRGCLQTLEEGTKTLRQHPTVHLEGAEEDVKYYSDHLLRTLAAETFNLLSVLVLKTQKNLQVLVPLLLADECTESGRLSLPIQSTFAPKPITDFLVVTSFQSEEFILTSYDLHCDDRQLDTSRSDQEEHSKDHKGQRSPLPDVASGCWGMKSPRTSANQRIFALAAAHQGLSVLRRGSLEPEILRIDTSKTKNQSVIAATTPGLPEFPDKPNFALQGSQLAACSNDQIELEMDLINSHRSMFKYIELLRVLLRPISAAKTAEVLRKILLQAGNPLSIRLFFLRQLLHFRVALVPHSALFLEPILQYLVSPDTGGKGLHYFYRDICGLLIEWGSFQPTEQWLQDHQSLCTSFFSTLMSKLGDTSRKVFDSNLEIFESVASLFARRIPLDTNLLLKFLMPNERTHVWQIVGIQILHILLSLDYPLSSQNASASETDLFAQKLERALLHLPQVNSKNLIQALGRLFALLAAKRVLFSDFRCLSGEQIGAKIKENFPRTNRRFLILVSQITAACSAFYLGQPALRKSLTDVLTGSNKQYVCQALFIYARTLAAVDSRHSAEADGLVADILEAAPKIIKADCVWMTQTLLNIFGSVLDLDVQKHLHQVARQVISIANRSIEGGHSQNNTELVAVIGRLLAVDGVANSSHDLLSELFGALVSCVNSFEQCLDVCKQSGLLSHLLSFQNTLAVVSKARTFDKTARLFCVVLLLKIAASNPEKTDRGGSELAVLANQALPPAMEIEETKPTLATSPSQPPYDSADDDDINAEIREDEDYSSQLILLQSLQAMPRLRGVAPVRFRKETNEMMPRRLLKMYTGFRDPARPANKTPKQATLTHAHPEESSVTVCGVLWELIKRSTTSMAQIFSTFCFEAYSSLKGTDRQAFHHFLLDLNQRVADLNFGLTGGVDGMSQVLFGLLKRGKLSTVTSEEFAQKVNTGPNTPLLQLMNEEVLFRLTKMQMVQSRTLTKELAIALELGFTGGFKDLTSSSADGSPASFKRIKESGAIWTSSQIPGDLIDAILRNAVNFASQDGRQSNLGPLSKALLPDIRGLASGHSRDTPSQTFAVIDGIDARHYTLAAQKLITAQKQECLRKMHSWDQVSRVIVAANPEALALDPSNVLMVKDFGRLSAVSQTQLVGSLIEDAKSGDTFISLVKLACKSRDQRNAFESRFSHELSTFWFGRGDFNQARYFNELEKECIQEEVRRTTGPADHNVFFRLGSVALMGEALSFVADGLQNEDVTDREINKMAGLLSCSQRSFRGLLEESVLGRFKDLKLIAESLIDRFKTTDCHSLLKVRLFNNIRLAGYLLNVGSWERGAAGLTQALAELPVDSDYLRYELAKMLVKADIRASLEGNGRQLSGVNPDTLGDLEAQLIGSAFRKPFRSLRALREFHRINFGPKWQRNSPREWVSCFEQLISSPPEPPVDWEPESPDTLEALYGHTQHDMQNLIEETVSKLGKAVIEQAMTGDHTGLPDLVQVLQSFLESTLRLLTTSRLTPTHHKMPFILRVIKCYPALCPEIFQRFFVALNPETFVDWIPQLISLASQSALLGEYFRSVFKRIALKCPEALAGHLFFHRANPWVAETIRILEKSLRPYFLFFTEVLTLKDPEITLTELLKELNEAHNHENEEAIGSVCTRILNLLGEAELLQSTRPIMEEFLRVLGEPLRRLVATISFQPQEKEQEVIAEVEYLLRGALASRFTRGVSQVAQYSPALARFPETFNSQNEIYFWFREKERPPARLVDLRETMTVIRSVMRPKRLTFICSDNKNRHLLLKYGEDLQEDARIMTVFRILNGLIAESRSPEELDGTRLFTYDVLPIARNVGLIEWVRESRSLKNLIEEEAEGDVLSSVSMRQRGQFIRKLAENPTERHLKLLSLPHEPLVAEYDTECAMFDVNSLKSAILHRCESPEAFLNRRRTMLREYALCCAVGYLIGIGDRHLDNILLIEDAHFCLIDFGCTFDFAIHLPMPEMVPFRFTPVLAKFGFPFETEGVFVPTLRQTLSLLRRQQDALNDYIEVYLTSPIEKWTTYNACLKQQTGQGPLDQNAFVKWKVAQFNSKLRGVDPRVPWLAELERSRHQDTPYYDDLRALVSEVTFDEIKDSLTMEEVVARLMSLATSKRLLVRMWSGWAPFV